jgi:hypothetical protein
MLEVRADDKRYLVMRHAHEGLMPKTNVEEVR